MFLARGLCYRSASIHQLTEAGYSELAQLASRCGATRRWSIGAVIAVAVVAVAMFAAHGTQFGRTVYAIGAARPPPCDGVAGQVDVIGVTR